MIIILLLIRSQWICQSCADCKNTELSGSGKVYSQDYRVIRQIFRDAATCVNKTQDVIRRKETLNSIWQGIKDTGVMSNNKTLNAIIISIIQNKPLQSIRNSASSLDPLGLFKAETVLDCMS